MEERKIFRGDVSDITLEHQGGLPARVFCIVSTKKFPKATQRNQIKRWCREVWYKNTHISRSNIQTTIRIKSKEINYKNIQNDITKAANTAF